MIDRITKNEERFDLSLNSINNLNNALDNFISNKNNINYVKKYYGSKNWFKDKEYYENNKIPKIKAGVLSEDGVWDMLDDIDELVNKMKEIINYYKK